MVKSPRSAKKALGQRPLASQDPVDQGRQHPLAPPRRLYPPPLAGVAGVVCLFSRCRHWRTRHFASVVAEAYGSTFLPPFAPPGITPDSRCGLVITLGASWCSLLPPGFPAVPQDRHLSHVHTPHRGSYEGSDSWGRSPPPPGLPAYRALPSDRSVPKHALPFLRRFTRQGQRSGCVSGFALGMQARHHRTPKRVR